jgi:hypothetical protein
MHKLSSHTSKTDKELNILSTERKWRCLHEGCGKSFKRLSHLRRHEIVHRALQERTRYLCSEPGCTKHYSTKYDLAAHIRQVHKGMQPFKCTVKGCCRRFVRKESLEKHLQTFDHSKFQTWRPHDASKNSNPSILTVTKVPMAEFCMLSDSHSHLHAKFSWPHSNPNSYSYFNSDFFTSIQNCCLHTTTNIPTHETSISSANHVLSININDSTNCERSEKTTNVSEAPPNKSKDVSCNCFLSVISTESTHNTSICVNNVGKCLNMGLDAEGSLRLSVSTEGDNISSNETSKNTILQSPHSVNPPSNTI